MQWKGFFFVHAPNVCYEIVYLSSYICFFHPIFSSLVFGILVTLVAWFSFFFCLPLQNVNNDYLIFSYFHNCVAKSDQKPKNEKWYERNKSPDRKALGHSSRYLKFSQRLSNAVVALRLPRDNGSYLNTNYNNVIISLSSCFGASKKMFDNFFALLYSLLIDLYQMRKTLSPVWVQVR